MQIPGLSGAMGDPVLREKAEKEAERLAETLKNEVQADISEIGTLRKRIRITVPAKVITEHLDHNYSELMQDAIVPGFRKGRAPRRLVEKRFGAEVRESMTTTIVGQAFFAVIEKHELEVLGDPVFEIPTEGEGSKLVDLDEALEHLKLPEEGDFSYACEVEIKPKFELPELKGIPIKSPLIEIKKEMVDEELLRMRKLRGRYEPRPEASAESDDYLIADVTFFAGDKEIKTEENVQFGVRPVRLDGIPLPTLGDVMKGAKVGETRSVECTIPEDYERADIRGQQGRFEFRIHELKRLAPVPMDEFLQQQSFDSEEDARTTVRYMIENQRDELIERARRSQVHQYLLDNTQLDLPEQLSARQTDRAVSRQILELTRQGVPDADVEARIDELRTSAREDAVHSLKLNFILDKVAEQLDVSVTDEEVNTAIAQMARRYNRRFDRVRDELQQRGLLADVAEQIRQDKVVAQLLADANIEETAAEEGPQEADESA